MEWSHAERHGHGTGQNKHYVYTVNGYVWYGLNG